MIKKIALPAILCIPLIFFSCKKTYETAKTNVVINELMPVNTTTVTDQYGEYDDWIELFNLTATVVDLSGYYLSDNKKDPGKWQFPPGTSIPANGYLIIWADNDTTQFGLHTNFKLSSAGEDAVLSDPNILVIDKISFPAQTLELSYSRVPNGTGSFVWQTPTFNKTNSSR
jgi:hypothetical protein